MLKNNKSLLAAFCCLLLVSAFALPVAAQSTTPQQDRNPGDTRDGTPGTTLNPNSDVNRDVNGEQVTPQTPNRDTSPSTMPPQTSPSTTPGRDTNPSTMPAQTNPSTTTPGRDTSPSTMPAQTNPSTTTPGRDTSPSTMPAQTNPSTTTPQRSVAPGRTQDPAAGTMPARTTPSTSGSTTAADRSADAGQSNLPGTASGLPLVGLIGAASLMGAAIRRRR